MRAKTQIIPGLLAVAAVLLGVLSLIGAKTHAQQGREEKKDQMVAVSRESLRDIATELSLIRDSINEDLKRIEKEYILVRQNGAKKGDPKENAIRTELERQRQNFNRLVDQIKRLNGLTGRK